MLPRIWGTWRGLAPREKSDKNTMDTTTRLILLRHGEVEMRYQRVFGGRIDMGLSPHGQDQVRALAAHLKALPIEGLYVSPMKRAQQSVAPLAAANRRTPIILPELQEVDFGAWTGLRWEQVRERFGVTAFDWLRELDRGGIPEAESMTDFRRRVEAALGRVCAAHAGGTVAVMCHGGVIRMMLASLLDLPLPKMAAFEIDYASMTVVDHHPRKTEVQLLNYTPWRSPS